MTTTNQTTTETTKSKSKKYQILSPNGFNIDFSISYYKSKKQALTALKNWRNRYKIQGYYSSTQFGRINLPELEKYCQLIEL